jgi:anti-sigma factor RsiW
VANSLHTFEIWYKQKNGVMKIDQSEKLIRRYLLGELAEADQAAFEQELLIDRGKFDQVWAVENELVDSYVRGEMSRADRRRFEGHYLASPLHRERVAIAESFLTNIDQAVGETVEARAKEPVVPWRRRFPLRSPRPVFGSVFGSVFGPVCGMALVMALLLTFGLVWSYIERVRLTGQIANVQKEAQTERAFLKQREQELASRNQEFEKEIADVSRRNEQLKAELEQLRRRRQASAPTVLSFLLAPAPARSEEAPPQSTILLSAGKARLLMELDDHDYANYQAVLQTVGGREILRRRTGKVRFGKDRAFATLPVKVGKLAKGDYTLILFSQTLNDRSKEIYRYFFRVS